MLNNSIELSIWNCARKSSWLELIFGFIHQILCKEVVQANFRDEPGVGTFSVKGLFFA